MKKINNKIASLAIGTVVTFGALSISCSSTDNDGYVQPAQGSIDVAVGSYKGKLKTQSNGPEDKYEWFDAVVIVTKEGNNRLKISAKSGEEYSFVTSKTFTVETGAFFGQNTQDIVSLTGSLEGIFHYYGSNKNIRVVTIEQTETDIYFEFEGVKQ